MSTDQQDPPDRTPRPRGGARRAPHEHGRGLPGWTNILVVVSMVALLTWSVVVLGAEGVGYAYVLGGVLGAYAGVDQLLRRRDKDGDGGDGGGPP